MAKADSCAELILQLKLLRQKPRLQRSANGERNDHGRKIPKDGWDDQSFDL